MSRITETPLNQSVERAARMLGLFTADEPQLTLAQLTERSGLTKATAHRYATALRRAGLLRSANGVYTLGPRIVELSTVALAGLSVVKLAEPYLQRLVEETSQTAVLSVWDGEAPVVVRVADNPERLVRIVVSTGSRLPPHSAQGKVFRAFLGEHGDDELELVRERRLAFYGHVVEGIAALAAPVFQRDEIVAALAVVGTTAALDADVDSAMAQSLSGAAAGLSAELEFLTDRRG